jgi:hypothetical protein
MIAMTIINSMRVKPRARFFIRAVFGVVEGCEARFVPDSHVAWRCAGSADGASSAVAALLVGGWV